MSGTPIRALAAMHARASRSAERPAEPKVNRTRVRLWLPLTPLFLLLSPLSLLLLVAAVFVPRPRGVSPLDVVMGIGRLLLSLGGTVIDVETPDASVRIKII